jgi:hypothetical protein
MRLRRFLLLTCLGLLVVWCDSADGVLAGAPWAMPDLDGAIFQAGSGRDTLRLEALDVNVTTHRVAATTRLSLHIRNDGQGVEEAILRLPVPPGAAVTRAVLFMGERPMPGVFVDRARAAEIYRTITNQRRDPALVEWDGESWVRVSVFPLEPGQIRRLDLEWLEPIATANGRAIYRVPVVAHRGKILAQPRTIVVDSKTVACNGLLVPLRVSAPPPLVFAATSPAEKGVLMSASAPTAKPAGLVLLAETSHTMPPSLPAQLEHLLAALPVDTRVSLLAVDWTAQVLCEAATPAQTIGKLDTLRAIHGAGRLDLAHALEVAAGLARKVDAHQVLFVGGGRNGRPDGDMKAALARALDQRLAVSAVDPDARSRSLRGLVAATGGRILTARPDGKVDPASLRGLFELPLAERSRPDLHPFFPLSTVTGETRWLALADHVDQAKRAEAKALLPLLARSSGSGPLAAQLVTPDTSLLVLETEADYARWGLPLPGASSAADGPVRPAREKPDPFRGAFRMAVSLGKPLLAACYDQALSRKPGIEGQVEAEITISLPSGRMAVASWDSTLRSPGLEACLKQAIGRWHFRSDFRTRAGRFPRWLALRFLPIRVAGRPLVLARGWGEDDPMRVAVDLLAKDTPLADRLREIAMLFEEATPKDAAQLAWWAYAQPRYKEGPARLWLVASLLDALGDKGNAIRVLSEIRCLGQLPDIQALAKKLEPREAVARLDQACEPGEDIDEEPVNVRR